ncbi:ABC transporter permease [Pelagibacterium lentulum]|uniref:ABC transporter permease n=1 Tax=Pelagibacterium lentulum TaxID=2029865 RepID=A0A916RA15_9HYPH|nr:ABC transporter permease [Pelagibacterium lentulum]GGA44781.1 ABC transporter permease [Pelagibacterium lentulum]
MIRVELLRRDNPSRALRLLSPLIGLSLALITGAIMFSLMGKNPAAALYVYFIEPLTEAWSVHELLIKAAPLILMGAGLSICYLSNNWNIGAEGQFIMGALAGSIFPVLFTDFQNPMVLPLMFIFAVAGGALWAGIPALLKARFNTNEILVSLMLVYVAERILDYLVRGPWRNPGGMNFPESVRFHSYARVPEIMPWDGRANLGIVIAILVAIALWFMLSRTLKGFEVKVIGASPRAGRFAGFSSKGMIFFSFLVAGGCAGLAGIIEVAGASAQLRPIISPGYGFTAIIVAFLGRLNPLGAIAAGLILALTYLGGEAAQISLQISDKASRVFQGTLLLYILACDTLIHYRIRFSRKPAAKGIEQAAASSEQQPPAAERAV